ncbi:MAG: substrate-binding domain-containing protein [Treponema sp.]|nr:substrate-binding domain-containing protein [Treponema sp.]
MKNNNSSLIILIFLTIVLPITFILFSYFSFSLLTKNTEIPERKFLVLVTGAPENITFLNNVFKGADEVSEKYTAVVELHVPSSKAMETSLSSLFEYAAFVNADGIIAYTDEETDSLFPPLKSDGTEIPVVTVGRYNQSIPQISFIGNNYSESGRLLARTTIEMYKPEYDLYVLSSAAKNSNYSTLLNTLTQTLKNNSLSPVILEGTALEIEESISKILLNNMSNPSLIVCLTEEDSIRTSQLAANPLYREDNIIISFGENETINTYLKKGIIKRVISVDQENTGARALKELFDYKKNNFANNYVYAGLKIKKGENEK